MVIEIPSKEHGHIDHSAIVHGYLRAISVAKVTLFLLCTIPTSMVLIVKL